MTTSAFSRNRFPFKVMSSGSPGPAPIKTTLLMDFTLFTIIEFNLLNDYHGKIVVVNFPVLHVCESSDSYVFFGQRASSNQRDGGILAESRLFKNWNQILHALNTLHQHKVVYVFRH